MDTLLTYLRETRTTPAAFAKLIGVDADRFAQMLAGETPIDAPIAQRMVDATGGALRLDDLCEAGAGDAAVVDLRSRFASEADEIDADALALILKSCLRTVLGGGRRKGDEHLPSLAAEAAAHTYLALSTVTTQRGEDRLIQALRPVFAAVLEESGASAMAYRRLDPEVRRAAELYFQARASKRRA